MDKALRIRIIGKDNIRTFFIAYLTGSIQEIFLQKFYKPKNPTAFSVVCFSISLAEICFISAIFSQT